MDLLIGSTAKSVDDRGEGLSRPRIGWSKTQDDTDAFSFAHGRGLVTGVVTQRAKRIINYEVRGSEGRLVVVPNTADKSVRC
jgi:hypothetical protein